MAKRKTATRLRLGALAATSHLQSRAKVKLVEETMFRFLILPLNIEVCTYLKNQEGIILDKVLLPGQKSEKNAFVVSKELLREFETTPERKGTYFAFEQKIEGGLIYRRTSPEEIAQRKKEKAEKSLAKAARKVRKDRGQVSA